MNKLSKKAWIVLMAAIISACGHGKGDDVAVDEPVNSEESPEIEMPQTDIGEMPAEAEEPPVTQLPFTLPDGFQAVDANAFVVAVPGDWHVENGYFEDIFFFQFNDKQIGKTEILGWFDSESWGDFKPNHSDQLEFQMRDDLLEVQGGDIHLYRIQLVHTKPAAERDPDWRYEETCWYVTVKESGLSYGFCFSSEDVDEKVMESIVSTLRLKQGMPAQAGD